jgi:hypothetical protein
MSKKGWRRKEEKIQDQTRLHNKEKKGGVLIGRKNWTF